MNRQNLQLNKYVKAYNAAFPAGTFDGILYPGGVFIPAYGQPADCFTPNADGALGGNPTITPYLLGKIMLPIPTRPAGTVQMYPGQVTRIMVRFTKQDGTAYGFDPILIQAASGTATSWNTKTMR